MSLAELPELVGFFSYSRDDDRGAAGRLTKLRERIHEELRSQLGRRGGNFRVWQDKAAIAEGTLWNNEIRTAVAQSVFFIPIITPTAIKSEHCKAEFDHFLGREKELGRNDLVFPILYIRVPELENESVWRNNPVLKVVGERHYLDWLELRHLNLDSREVGIAIERFCRSIHDALCRPWPADAEADWKGEQEARQHKEEERRRQQIEEDRLRVEAALIDRQRQAEQHANEEARRSELKRLQDEQARNAAIEKQRLDTGPGSPPRGGEIKRQEASAEEIANLQRKVKGERKILGGLGLSVMVVTGICLFLSKDLTLSIPFSRGLPVVWLFFMGCLLLNVILILLTVSILADHRKTKNELRRLQK